MARKSTNSRSFYVARRRIAHQGKMESLLSTLRQSAPKSPWLGEALLTIANVYLLDSDYDRAIDCYRECVGQIPRKVSELPYAHWKALWLDLQQNRMQQAKAELEEQIANVPLERSPSRALYWRARMAEDDQRPGQGEDVLQQVKRSLLQLLLRRLGCSIKRVSGLADARAGRTQSHGCRRSSEEPALEKIPPANLPTRLSTAEPPADDFCVRKRLCSCQKCRDEQFCSERVCEAAAPFDTRKLRLPARLQICTRMPGQCDQGN